MEKKESAKDFIRRVSKVLPGTEESGLPTMYVLRSDATRAVDIAKSEVYETSTVGELKVATDLPPKESNICSAQCACYSISKGYELGYYFYGIPGSPVLGKPGWVCITQDGGIRYIRPSHYILLKSPFAQPEEPENNCDIGLRSEGSDIEEVKEETPKKVKSLNAYPTLEDSIYLVTTIEKDDDNIKLTVCMDADPMKIGGIRVVYTFQNTQELLEHIENIDREKHKILDVVTKDGYAYVRV